eukprot:3187479-Prymnesium_polylepis.1
MRSVRAPSRLIAPNGRFAPPSSRPRPAISAAPRLFFTPPLHTSACAQLRPPTLLCRASPHKLSSGVKRKIAQEENSQILAGLGRRSETEIRPSAGVISWGMQPKPPDLVIVGI